MQHPDLLVKMVTDFLDHVIEEHGHILYMVFVYVCIGVIVWMLTRQRKCPVQDFYVVILPLGVPPKIEPERRPRLFDDHNSI